MAILCSVPILAILLASLVLAVLSRRGILPYVTGLLSVCCGALLPVLVTAQGGTMYDVLLFVCAPLFLLMPKRKNV